MDNNDYFAKLVNEARQRAAKAMVKFPQPNYVLNKVAEEHGEVIKGVIHYLEGRETWQNVENELIDNLAMLIRLVTEGDQVIGFTPPRSCFVGLPVDTMAKAMQNAPLSPSDNQGAGVRALKGFVLMPSDPTPEMLEEICLTEGFTENALRARYAALIAAGQKVVQDGD